MSQILKKNLPKVTIVGAGFSGLTLAWILTQKNIPVEIVDRNLSESGLIRTYELKTMLVETAANAILWTEEIETLFRELNLPYFQLMVEARSKYFFRKKIRKWPLGFVESLSFIFKVLKSLSRGLMNFRPKPGESICDFGLRNFGPAATEHLLATGLQGIYAGDIRKMSASLCLGHYFTSGTKHPRKKFTSISPQKGMGQLIQTLKDQLLSKNVEIRKQEWDGRINGLTIFAGSLEDVQKNRQYLFDQADGIENLTMLPILRVTVSFRETPPIQGFGILIDASENLKTLGVLMNTYTFENRGTLYNESWIIGGSKSPEVLDLSDDRIRDLILSERAKILKRQDTIIEMKVTRWTKAFPHYDLALEKAILSWKTKENCFLTGNYLGRLGLSDIYSKNLQLAEVIQRRVNESGFS